MLCQVLFMWLDGSPWTLVTTVLSKVSRVSEWVVRWLSKALQKMSHRIEKYLLKLLSRNRTTFMACGEETAEEQKGWRRFLRSRPGLRISEDQYFPWHWSWLLLPTIDLPRQIILTSYAWIFPSLLFLIIFRHASVSSTYPCQSVGPFVSDTFETAGVKRNPLSPSKMVHKWFWNGVCFPLVNNN